MLLGSGITDLISQISNTLGWSRQPHYQTFQSGWPCFQVINFTPPVLSCIWNDLIKYYSWEIIVFPQHFWGKMMNWDGWNVKCTSWKNKFRRDTNRRAIKRVHFEGIWHIYIKHNVKTGSFFLIPFKLALLYTCTHDDMKWPTTCSTDDNQISTWSVQRTTGAIHPHPWKLLNESKHF